MIREFEFYHGPVLARIVHATKGPISIQSYPSPSNASYVLNEKVGLYIKHSSKRMTPWRFSFAKIHQDEIDAMKKKLGTVYLVLVCNDDGIVCLSHAELKHILDDEHEPVEWVSVSRNPRQMYTIKGSDGELGFKIGANEFPTKLFEGNEIAARPNLLAFFRTGKHT